MKTFLSSSFQNVRSSKRTDELHTVLLAEVLEANPQWAGYDWQFEYRLPVDGFGGTFDIDIAGFVNGELKVAVLAKAMNSNVNKNIKNYANTTIGEAARLTYAPGLDLEAVLFVSVLPRTAPRFNKAGEVVGLDNVLSAKARTNIGNIIEAQYGGLVQVIDLFFDIDGVTEMLTSADFHTISVSNVDKVAA
jgi:hypothetical protein